MNFCNSLHRESSNKDIWNKVKKFNGIYKTTSFVPIHDHLRRNILQSMVVTDWDLNFQKEQSPHRTEEFTMTE